MSLSNSKPCSVTNRNLVFSYKQTKTRFPKMRFSYTLQGRNGLPGALVRQIKALTFKTLSKACQSKSQGNSVKPK